MSSMCSTGPHGRAAQPANAFLFVCICALGKHLIIAIPAQMGKCLKREKLKEMRRNVVLPEQGDQAVAAQTAHAAAAFKYRRVDALVQGKA